VTGYLIAQITDGQLVVDHAGPLHLTRSAAEAERAAAEQETGDVFTVAEVNTP
jgi:hypothetical protein